MTFRVLTYIRLFIGTEQSNLLARLYEEFTELSKKVKLIVVSEDGLSTENISLVKISKISKPFTFKILYKILVFSIATIKQRNNYDVVFIRITAIPHLFPGILAKIILRKKLVVYLSGNDMSKTGITKKIYRILISKALSVADAISYTSERNIEEAENFLRIKIERKKAILVKQGINTTQFRSYNKNNNNTIISVGRLKREKQFEQIIKAMPCVLQTIPDVKLMIVGNIDDKNYLKRLKRLISKLECEKNVEFVGPIPYNRIVHYYNCAKIFVMTSVGEGFSNATFEAMACEKPVIVTRAGTRTELVKDGVNGFLVDYNSPQILAEKIILLLKDEKYREKLGKEARVTVLKNCDWSFFINSLADVLKKVNNHEIK